jgi:UDP-N-acetylmuramate--alanine ligase
MIFEFLTACGKNPSLISGADLTLLTEQGLIGNAFHGTSDLLVIEADESDGTCAKYRPALSVFLNVSKDHKPVAETMEIFRKLAAQSKSVVANADDRRLAALKPSVTFGVESKADHVPDRVLAITPAVSFVKHGQAFRLPLPGAHNLSNTLAALAVCGLFGCDAARLAEAVAGYRGVRRRFSVTTLSNGVRVIDDFAHNPDKIRAALRTAHGLAPRVAAVFQPHGFGPTRFLQDELVAVFGEELTKDDMLCLLPIYYAGGTATRDISSGDLVARIRARGAAAFAPKDRAECLGLLASAVRPGDAVLVMGARDPSLSAFVKQIEGALDI